MASSFDLVPPPLNARYEGGYGDSELRWRRICAEDKAKNLIASIGDRKGQIESVVEIGCGTGAVLLALAKRGVGRTHLGIDVADPAAHADPGVLSTGIEMREYDGIRIPLPDASADLVYASHVLEHVPDERGLLSELARIARGPIYIEVPCEVHVRTSVKSLKRTLEIGHINAYTPETFALTLATSGLEVVDLKLFDHSVAVHAFHCSELSARAKKLIRGGLLAISPRWASRVFTYHCGALCLARAVPTEASH